MNEALKGKVEVKVFHSSQLGSDEQMIKGIRVASPEMVAPSTVMSTVDQRYGVFEMPYLIVNRAHMKKVAENKQVQKTLFDPLPARGIRVLGVWENGFRHITNNRRPIKVPGDLNDIKLRVPGGVWRVKMFKAYGANPSPMPFSEVYSALQQGVMDGQENPFPQIWSAKFHEVQKYLSLTGPRLHARLPHRERGLLEEAPQGRPGHDLQDRLGDRRFRALRGRAAGQGAACPSSRRRCRSTSRTRMLFIKASGAVYEEFGKEIPGGAELVKLIQSLR